MDNLKQKVRKLLPKQAVRVAEEAYRWSRAYAVATRYGHPARNLRVVAITGTNGKTTTANYLNEMLKAGGMKTAMFTTAVIEIAGERQLNDLNATVGTTARMQQFFRDAKKAGVDMVVLEITSHALHQHKLATVPIECAVMTNLTQDHLDYHKTMQAYAEAKGKLFAKRPRCIVLNRDDEWFDFFAAFEPDEYKISYGTHEDADFRIDAVKLFKTGSEVQIEADYQTHLDLVTALPGKFNVYNLTAAAAAAYILRVDLEAITEGGAALKEIPGRFEHPVEGLPYDVIVDYAHTPDALTQFLEAVRHLTKGRVILVFGATGDRDKGKRPIMGEIAAKLADRIFVTDEESYNEDPTAIRQMVLQGIEKVKGSAKTEEITDRRAAIEKALSIARRDDTVVITGMGHEQFRIINGEKLPWNDGEVVREILASKK